MESFSILNLPLHRLPIFRTPAPAEDITCDDVLDEFGAHGAETEAQPEGAGGAKTGPRAPGSFRFRRAALSTLARTGKAGGAGFGLVVPFKVWGRWEVVAI